MIFKLTHDDMYMINWTWTAHLIDTQLVLDMYCQQSALNQLPIPIVQWNNITFRTATLNEWIIVMLCVDNVTYCV